MSHNEQKPEHWKDDKLDRYKQGLILKDFLDQQYESGFLSEDKTKSFVLNLDAQWGYGKTFFLDRFAKDLECEHLVLRYNAWANDYAKDPLLSFIAQITRELTAILENEIPSAEGNKKRAQKFRENALRVIRSAGKAAAPRLLSAGVSTLVLGVPVALGSSGESEASEDSDGTISLSPKGQELVTKTIGASVEAALSNASSDIFDEENSRRTAVETFKNSLSDIVHVLTEQESSGTQSDSRKAPIYILIDELDRCRPDFTIELIECVKHLFSVNGLYFIFATDGNQLQAAINGVYGESFDAELYFNRIFNKEIGLRIPDQRQLSEALIKEFGLEDYKRYNIAPLAFDSKEMAKVSLQEDFSVISSFFGLDLRSQKQVLSAFHTMTLSRHRRSLVTDALPALALIVLWQRKKDLFRNLMNTPNNYKGSKNIEPVLRSAISNGNYDLTFQVATHDPREPFRGSRKAPVSVPLVLSSFIQMYSYDPVQYVEDNHNSNRHSGEVHCYVKKYQDLLNKVGLDADRRNPLTDYFEDITMVS